MTSITSPTLLLDEHKVRLNIRRMAEKAERNNLTFRPHFKTHQSTKVGDWFKEHDVNGITVSSISMAEYFADAGWDDITIAFPVNIREIDRINSLAGKIKLAVLVSDPYSLSKLCRTLSNHLHIYIEIDTGSGRTGFQPDQDDIIARMLETISEESLLNFRGFYSHPGHSYSARTSQEIRSIHNDAAEKLRSLKERYRSEFTDLICCLGDTPCCSVADTWEGIDEMSPGNFVFYDLMQNQIGSCSRQDIAIALACPVVATYPQRNEIVIHGGAVHLSKDRLKIGNTIHYGEIVMLNDDHTWKPEPALGSVLALSQEHGTVSCSAALDHIELKPGDLVGVLPVHSCLTADTMHHYRSCGSMDAIDHMRNAYSSNQ